MIICELNLQLTSKIIDFETAFLHGTLEEEIYMNCPEGLDHEPDECLQLQKTIYGLVQSAQQWYRKVVECLKEIGFNQSMVDPCLMTKRTGEGVVFLGLYVNDCYCCGHEKEIEKVVNDIRKMGYKIKVEDNLADYLSCKVIFDKNKTKAWLGQPYLIRNLEEKFGDLVKGLQEYKTPGAPGHGIVRPDKEDEKLNEADQKTYRSGVGMLLYLVKHSRPDLANTVRELSKVMDGATAGAMKELKRAIKFVLNTKEFGLKIVPEKPGADGKWKLMMYSDSEYAGDKKTRISVGGFVLFVCGVPVLWRSRAQRSVTLSSAEAEYIALSEAAKEIRFVHQLLTGMGFHIEIPIVIRVDNIGAIFMAENPSTNGRTRHVDVRYHFV